MIFKICIILILAAASVEDVRKREVSALAILSCTLVSAAAVGYGAYRGDFDALSLLLSLLPGAAVLFVALMSREGVGYGDGFLILASGPALGAGAVYLGLLAALFAAAAFSGILITIKRAGRRTRIPFVPFMALGMGAMILEKI